jgi:ankyrin repeat protein
VLGAADVDCSSVRMAAARSHSGCLQSLLKQPGGATAVLQLDENQHTCLHQVQHFTVYCTNITAALLRDLTQQQQLTAVINRTDSSGRTALRRTVVNQGDSTRVCHGCTRLLLAAGADIIEDEWQTDILAEVLSETTMYDDSSNDAELTVQALVQRGLDVEQANSKGLTRLQQLAQSLSEACMSAAKAVAVAAAMRALIANGSDPMATGNAGSSITPLCILVNSLDSKYDRFLRADQQLRCSNAPAIRAIYDSAGAACLAAKHSYGNTPLNLAVQWPGYVQLLIELGAEVNAHRYPYETPLHRAAERGAELSVQLLINAGAIVNTVADPDNEEGLEPLHCAATNHHYSVCKLLLERGAHLNARTENYETALRCAIIAAGTADDKWCERAMRCIQLFVDAGADIVDDTALDVCGTLLHSSASITCTAITQYLLDKLLPQHPDVLNKEKEYDGTTALYCAAACSNTAVVKLLLSSAASVNIDSSALLHACFKTDGSSASDLAMLNTLLDAGVSIMQLDDKG